MLKAGQRDGSVGKDSCYQAPEFNPGTWMAGENWLPHVSWHQFMHAHMCVRAHTVYLFNFFFSETGSSYVALTNLERTV